MRTWSRWQDWTALLAGTYAFLAPIWTTSSGAATGTLVAAGILVAALALWALGAPGSVGPRWLLAILGVLIFISPWVLGFHALAGVAWTAWIVGVVTCVAVPKPADRSARSRAATA